MVRDEAKRKAAAQAKINKRIQNGKAFAKSHTPNRKELEGRNE